MMFIQTPTFTDADIYVIKNTDRKVLKASIEFLKTYQEIMWLDNDTGEIVSHSELKTRRLRIQPQPQYPEELITMGEMFWRMMRPRKDRQEDFRVGLRNEGFGEENSLAACYTGTMYSAALIASYICFSFVHERLYDGYFGHGVENGLYLKMLLRLEDLIRYYDYSTAKETPTMKRNLEMYTERNKLLKEYINQGVPASAMLKLVEPMDTMSEEEKEAFAKDLRLRLENGEIKWE